MMKATESKTISELDLKEFSINVWNTLVAITGAKFHIEEGLQELDLLFNLLKVNYPKTPHQEIVLAYSFADKGLLTDLNGKSITLFRQIDYRATSEIIQAYKRFFGNMFHHEFKNQSLFLPYTEESKKEETFEEVFQHFFNIVNENGYFYSIQDIVNIYDELISRKVLKISDVEFDICKTKVFKMSQKQLIEKKKKGTSFGSIVELNQKIATLSEEDLSIIDLTKKIILENKIYGWKEQGKTIIDIL